MRTSDMPRWSDYHHHHGFSQPGAILWPICPKPERRRRGAKHFQPGHPCETDVNVTVMRAHGPSPMCIDACPFKALALANVRHSRAYISGGAVICQSRAACRASAWFSAAR